MEPCSALAMASVGGAPVGKKSFLQRGLSRGKGNQSRPLQGHL